MASPEVGGQGGGITDDLRAFFKARSNAQNLTDFAMGATLGECLSPRARIRDCLGLVGGGGAASWRV